MLVYSFKRLLAALPVMLVVSLVVFGLVHLVEGDPALIMAGELATPEQIAAIRESLGLSRPLGEQYLIWVGGVLRGDLGMSMFTRLPVSQLIAQRLEPTLALALSAMVLALCMALPAGVLAAWFRGRAPDRVIMVASVIVFSMPAFLIGYLLVYVFSIRLQWLPAQGFSPLAEGWVPFVRSLALPSVTLALVYLALLARMTRATMLEVLEEDYIRMARAKGLGEGRILFTHALKNAAVPIVTTAGFGLALLIGGAVVVESVFALPGLGRLTVEAVLRRDYPVIQGVLLVFSAAYVVINLLIDLSYRLFDPRIKY